MDRNWIVWRVSQACVASLSARRAWIEINRGKRLQRTRLVALRKESVDRNLGTGTLAVAATVALRKESVDRNTQDSANNTQEVVALRKESVDRNRNWAQRRLCRRVALRKESVDRNFLLLTTRTKLFGSLSARRAWIEICLPIG